jgi:hypothetical protein
VHIRARLHVLHALMRHLDNGDTDMSLKFKGTKQAIRKQAKELGHKLSRFERHSENMVVATCTACDAYVRIYHTGLLHSGDDNTAFTKFWNGTITQYKCPATIGSLRVAQNVAGYWQVRDAESNTLVQGDFGIHSHAIGWIIERFGGSHMLV